LFLQWYKIIRKEHVEQEVQILKNNYKPGGIPNTSQAQIRFEKYQTNGNNFIIIDGRVNNLQGIDLFSLARQLCNSRMSVGADGVLLLQESDTADIRMRLLEPDGTESDMCGNGVCCISLYFYNTENRTNLSIEANQGIVHTSFNDRLVEFNVGNLQDPSNYVTDPNLFSRFNENILQIEHDNQIFYILNIGEPHAVIISNDLDVDLRSYHDFLTDPSLFPNGINLNVISRVDDDTIVNRTYERGVWDYTTSCGTGSVCSAVIARDVLNLNQNRICVINLIGSHLVRFTSEGIISSARPNRVFSGTMEVNLNE